MFGGSLPGKTETAGRRRGEGVSESPCHDSALISGCYFLITRSRSAHIYVSTLFNSTSALLHGQPGIELEGSEIQATAGMSAWLDNNSKPQISPPRMYDEELSMTEKQLYMFRLKLTLKTTSIPGVGTISEVGVQGYKGKILSSHT